jgi:hypothetical protein
MPMEASHHHRTKVRHRAGKSMVDSVMRSAWWPATPGGIRMRRDARRRGGSEEPGRAGSGGLHPGLLPGTRSAAARSDWHHALRRAVVSTNGIFPNR